MPNQIADAFDRAALRKAAEDELARIEKQRIIIENADVAVDDIIAWHELKQQAENKHHCWTAGVDEDRRRRDIYHAIERRMKERSTS